MEAEGHETPSAFFFLPTRFCEGFRGILTHMNGKKSRPGKAQLPEIIAVLVNVRSVHNVGSIFRTADGAGISKIYLCGTTPTPLDRFGNFRKDFTKVSLGAERSVAWEHISSAGRLLDALRRRGYKLFAVEQDKGSIPYSKAKSFRRGKICIVMGEETRGLPKGLLRRAHAILEIPMFGTKESLNVSVAFGIVVYALVFGYG